MLETHAGMVKVQIKGTFPAKYFDKNTIVEATPVLVYEGGETALKSVKLQGEKVLENNEVINYVGDNFNYNDEFAFVEGMRKSELVLRVKATRKTTSLDFDPIKLADGVIATSTLVEVQAKPGMIADAFKRIIPENKSADIHYVINRAELRKTELSSDDVKMLQDYIKMVNSTENLVFKGTTVSSYASPDGKFDLNEKLAGKRSEAASGFVKKTMETEKVADVTNPEFITSKYTAEDWDGFKTAVEASTIQDKELILRVLSMYSDPAVRETEIKNMSAAFEVLAEEILPKLRRSQLIVNVDKIGRTDEQILELAKSDIKVLGLEEMLYAATLTQDANEQLGFYEAAAEAVPKCFRAHNNVGYTYIKLGKPAEAMAAFEKAKALQNNDVIKNNMGYAALMQNDLVKADEYFNSLAAPTADSKFGLGIIALKKGEYDKAVNLLGTEPSFNLALALLLKGDVNRAKTTLESMEPCKCGRPSYLKAVVGARLDDADYTMNNLREAVGYNEKWKAVASTDLEFAKFFADETFMGIVK